LSCGGAFFPSGELSPDRFFFASGDLSPGRGFFASGDLSPGRGFFFKGELSPGGALLGPDDRGSFFTRGEPTGAGRLPLFLSIFYYAQLMLLPL
jgi:hypothetical protein